MAKHSRKPERIVRFTASGLRDVQGIDNSTAAMWGELQAERYLAFMREVFANLAHDPRLGKVVDQHPDVLVYSVKFSKRRSAHGHRIFYREIEGGIRVIRVLHTAMHWPDHLGIADE